MSEEFMQQLGLWLQRHGSNLQHLSLDLDRSLLGYDRLVPCQELARAVEACSSLRSLRLLQWDGPELPDLQQFTQLTSLRLQRLLGQYEWRPQQVLSTLLSLPLQLRSLDISKTQQGVPQLEEQQVHQLVTRLPHLTSLDMRGMGTYNAAAQYLASCQSLPPLQELKLSLYWRSVRRGRPLSLADLEGFAKVPCTFLDLQGINCVQDLQDFTTWSAGPQGKICLGKLTGFECSLAGDGRWGAPLGHPWSHDILPCLVAAAGNLRSLCLKERGGGSGISDLNLLTGLRQLTSLEFNYVTGSSEIVTQLAALPNLQHLSVAGLSAVETHAVRAAAVRAAAVNGQLSFLKELRVLAIEDTRQALHLPGGGGVM